MRVAERTRVITGRLAEACVVDGIDVALCDHVPVGGGWRVMPLEKHDMLPGELSVAFWRARGARAYTVALNIAEGEIYLFEGRLPREGEQESVRMLCRVSGDEATVAQARVFMRFADQALEGLAEWDGDGDGNGNGSHEQPCACAGGDGHDGEGCGCCACACGDDEDEGHDDEACGCCQPGNPPPPAGEETADWWWDEEEARWVELQIGEDWAAADNARRAKALGGKKPARPKGGDPGQWVELPGWVLSICPSEWRPLLRRWVGHRAKIGRPYSGWASMEMAYRIMRELSGANLELAERIVQQSIDKGWSTLVELREMEGA